jgi:glutamate 5-kinase
MVTKLKAAQLCMESGCDMVIANGSNPGDLYAIAEGQPVGTRFRASR